MERAASCGREVIPRLLHEVDEHVLQPGVNLVPSVFLGSERGDGAFQFARIIAANVEHRTECNRLLHARAIPQLLRENAEIKGEVAVLGNLTYLEVRNMEAFRQEIKTESFTSEDEKTLDELGI